MSSSKYFSKRRRYLIAKDPHCFWCGRLVKEYPLIKRHQKIPNDSATIDHLASRFSGKRKEVHFKEKTLVLACRVCNNERQKLECKKNIWKTRWKSGAFPKGLKWLGKLLKLYRYARNPL